ncbi:MAG: Uma2 family endonuclease [Chloroflexi bacterium]|nr:Uma2 family endonuclease [Chloroflexota bacterium]
MAAHGVRFLASDIWDAPDNGKIYEVIDGELYVSPSPAWRHQLQLNRLNKRVINWVDDHHLGYVVPAPTGVVLDDENGLEPDIIFISHERAHYISERGVEGPPDLVVEVLSPSTEARDRGIKLRRYGAAGVTHYWILDPEGPRIEERVLGERGYQLVCTVDPGEVFRPTLFPGLEIPLDELAD